MGQQVKVTVTCGGSQVRDVTSAAFAKARNVPAAAVAAWSPNMKAARTGKHAVTIRCKNGDIARTTVTVN